jgi:8-oxo-dGTP pyrophosphatase MutT (NUDIX family)
MYPHDSHSQRTIRSLRLAGAYDRYVQIPEPEFLRKPSSEPPAAPRPAATVILLRGGGERLEVLLVRRNPQARFMPGAWVFPGGSVGPEDGDGERGLRKGAIRELREEAGIELDRDDELIAFARWITPVEAAMRFDTWFFLARAPVGARPVVDGQEIVDHRWSTPAAALAANAAGRLSLVFPTIKQLAQLATFGNADDLLQHARGMTVEPVQPRVLLTAGTARIVLPGEPGYDS